MMKNFFYLVLMVVSVGRFGFAQPSGEFYQKWLKERQESDARAAGPSGLFAIQDMIQLHPSESASLAQKKSLAELRWQKGQATPSWLQVEYKEGRVMISADGLTLNLLDQPQQQKTFSNGLTVRATRLHKEDMKIWLYNPNHERRKLFRGFPYFPYRAEGVVKAKLLMNPKPRVISYLDSRQQNSEMFEVGSVELTFDGKPFEFRAFSDESDWAKIDEVAIFFRDQTSGKSTYGGGRDVAIDFPKGKPNAEVWVDFNRAGSFTCAYSRFYNCPIPLATKIEAKLEYGEKYDPHLSDH